MKQTKHILLTITLLLCSLTASGYSFKVNGIYYRITSSSELTVGVADAGNGTNSYSSAGYTNLVIPETVTYDNKTYRVTSIVDGAFYGCNRLTSLFIPASINEISSPWWSSSTNNLTSIVVDENNVVFDSRGGCNAVVETNGNVLVLGGLSTVIPSSVTAIGNRAFFGCSGLTSITIPEGVTSIGDGAFSGCSGLTTVTIPSSVTSVENGAFRSCENLTSIVVEEGNTKYDSREGCNAIIQTRIHRLIVGCSTTIIPDNVKGIGEYAFYGCSNLSSITIPSSVTSIGMNAFYGCSSLSAVYISDISAWCNIEFGASSANPLCYAHSLYLNDELVTKLTIPEDVTSIGKYAFYQCSSLAEITIPESVTSIEESAFAGSTLASVTIPSSVVRIGVSAFASCNSLVSITIPEDSKLTTIGDYAFYNCSNVTSIAIPASVTSIGKYVFYNTTGELLIDCNVYGTQYSNDDRDFFGCKFSKIFFGDNVSSIGKYAFYNCATLTSIAFSENSKLTSIGEQAFYNCKKLTSVEFPESLKAIYSGAFSGCSNITTIILPSSVTSIGSNAFANYLELLDIYCYAESVPRATADAFSGSYPEYATLHVPASALETYKTTAPWSSFGTIVPLTEEKVTGITLNQSTATLTEGQTLTLIATVEPGYATDKTITWSSSDSNVATVDDKGKVTAIAPGTATITATAGDGSGVKASCVLIVEETLYIKITINQYGSGTYSSKYALDFSRVEGLKAYAAAGYNKKTGVVTLLRVNTTQPGTGIFLKGEPGKKYEVSIIEESDDNVMNMLVGTLTPTQVNEYSADGQYRNYKYTIKEGDSEPKFYQFTDGSTMGAGKAYLQIPTAWLPAGETRSIGLRFDEGEGTTDMEEFTIDNSQLTIIYDLFGRRVAQPVKGSLYIVNGRKVVY